MSSNQKIFEKFYREADGPEGLPWHRDHPPHFLDAAIQAKAPPARALDVGCGTGTYSVHLAQCGYKVTGIDFVEDALKLARNRAKEAGVTIEFENCDVLSFRPNEPYDLVIDSGCLHSLDDKTRPAYLDNLLSWLRPGGQFVLVHFNKRHAIDWRPFGPRRWKRARVEAFLADSFTCKDYHEEILHPPFPIGPTALCSTYWLERVQP